METSPRHWSLYILKLEQGKYYVGITSKTVEERFWEHKHKLRAAYWTMKYEPQEIMYSEELGLVAKSTAEKHENEMIRRCLKKYGINNARGGDIKDTRDYVYRFGRYFIKEDWSDLVHVSLMLLLLIAFYIDKYLVVFISGGLR